jgi:hypothetical protein
MQRTNNQSSMTYVRHMINICERYVRHMEDENEVKNENKSPIRDNINIYSLYRKNLEKLT